MPSIVEALDAIQSLAGSTIAIAGVDGVTALPTKWRDSNFNLPDEPAPFVYFELIAEPANTIERNGGRGRNRHRNRAELNGFVFLPSSWSGSLRKAIAVGEQVALVFRSRRTAGVSYPEATVHPVGEGAAIVPPGMASAAADYVCVVVVTELFFDQIG